MRTNIVIDEKLMAEAIKATGAKTKKMVTVEQSRCRDLIEPICCYP